MGHAPPPSLPSRSRRRALRATLLLPALGMAGWRCAFAGTTPAFGNPYGPLGPPDEHGVQVPAGFSVRLLGMTNEVVDGTHYLWHAAPDGGACFMRRAGGWIYANNSEVPDAEQGGASAIAFNAEGKIADAYSILAGTAWNCAGGPTPWGTWLSCEEKADGLVWECDPQGAGQGVPRPALGHFKHEAAAVDAKTGYVYLTEDEFDGRLYRFRPRRRRDLSAGTLEVARVADSGVVVWGRLGGATPARGGTSTPFQRGEGAWVAGRTLYFATTADHRVWALDLERDRLSVIYDAAEAGSRAVLREPDNVTVHPLSGDIFVAEDSDDLQLVLLADRAGRTIGAPFLQLVGHDDSEVTGPAFSPDGSRLYVNSQRGRDGLRGMTFEISGPFRRR